MTRFERKKAGSGHRYTLDGFEIPGVTTIIGTLDKPALINWAADQSATYAVENWARLSEIPLIERHKQIKNARNQRNREAIVKGNRIHALAEKLQKGLEVEVPAAIEPQVEAVARFMDDWEIQTIHTETPVCNTDYRYGGTLDTISTAPRLGTVLLDWKTGKGVYDETALQLAAYQHADLALAAREVVGPRGGRKTVYDEISMPPVDGCYVAHVLADAIELHPVTTDDQVFRAFQHLRMVYAMWIERVGWKYRDTPTYAPTIHKPIYLEDRPIGATK